MILGLWKSKAEKVLNSKPYKHYIYRCYDCKGGLLYVGTTNSLEQRLANHRSNSEWGERIALTRYETFNNKDLALDAEEEAIKTEYPKHNAHHRAPRPNGLWNASSCSFICRDDKGEVVTGGIRIESLLDPDDLPKSHLVMDKKFGYFTGKRFRRVMEMDKKIYDVAGNAKRLYEILNFEPWDRETLEIEPYALLSILGFNYTFKYFEDFRRMVIDPSLEMLRKCSDRSFSYTTKEKDGRITYVVFSRNRRPRKPS